MAQQLQTVDIKYSATDRFELNETVLYTMFNCQGKGINLELENHNLTTANAHEIAYTLSTYPIGLLSFTGKTHITEEGLGVIIAALPDTGLDSLDIGAFPLNSALVEFASHVLYTKSMSSGEKMLVNYTLASDVSLEQALKIQSVNYIIDFTSLDFDPSILVESIFPLEDKRGNSPANSDDSGFVDMMDLDNFTSDKAMASFVKSFDESTFLTSLSAAPVASEDLAPLDAMLGVTQLPEFFTGLES